MSSSFRGGGRGRGGPPSRGGRGGGFGGGSRGGFGGGGKKYTWTAAEQSGTQVSSSPRSRRFPAIIRSPRPSPRTRHLHARLRR